MTNKEKIARRVTREFREGEVINLGAGLPTLAAQFLPEGMTVFLQTENGIVGAGKDDPSLPRDLFRTDAGENPVSIIPGGAIVDSCTSFGIIRGGHLDVTVLGTMQVDETGSLANWSVPGGKMVGMGGAMDLVAGAKRVIVATEHCTKQGTPKVLRRCTYPLTGYRVVDTIITELAVMKVTPAGLLLQEMAPDIDLAALRACTDAPLIVPDTVSPLTAE